MNIKISLVMATAKGSYPSDQNGIHLVDKKGPHLFDITLKSLERQTFTDFEFIIVDALYHKRKDFFQNKHYSFPIKHIEPRPNIWLRKGMWALCSARNQGIIHSDGELVVFIDDIFGFGPDWLELFWKYYDEDVLFAQALSDFYTREGEKVIRNGEWIRDSRWKFIDEGSEHLRKHGDAYIHNVGDWFYGAGASASMEMLLRVNGFDENFDGTKSLEDCDLGRRLVELGCEFVFDKRLKSNGYDTDYHFENLTYKGSAFKSNFPLVQINSDRHRIVVNKDLLTEDEVKFVREESLKWNVTIVDELFELWVDNQPIFDLRELRLS